MNEEGRWVTIRGRHVFIKNGQTVSEAIKEYEKNKNKTSTTYYRGITQKYEPSYDKSKLDNPNGYESWTDSLELAKEYAGKNGYVYSVEIPNKELNPNDIYDKDGERSLMYYNDKPVALHGVEGEEFMLYTDHEKWNDLEYKEVPKAESSEFKDYSVKKGDNKSPYEVNFEIGKEKFDTPSNEYLDRYIQRGTDLPSREEAENYYSKYNEEIREIQKLATPAPENFTVYSGIRTSDDLSQRKVISTSLQETIANLYKMRKGSNGITVPIHIEKDAKIISTFNVIDKGGVGNNVHFKNQGEIIIPVKGNKIIRNEDGSYTVKKDPYYQAKLDFDSDGKDRIVKLSDGSEIKMLDKKDYKRISTEFADSLDEKETKRIQSYVDAPGYSGELNDYDPYDENKKSGTRYLYNTTDEKLFIPKNELNKYYNDMRDKFNKEVGTKLNSNWPTDEEREWAKNVLGTDDDHKVRQLLEGIDRATPKTYDEAYENQYYTKDQIDHFKEVYDKIKPLDNKLRDYEYDDPEYKNIQDQMKELNDTGHGIYRLETLANIDKEMVVNTKDYDFDQLLDEGKLKYIGAKELKDLKEYSPNQSSIFYNNKQNIENMLNNFNELFDKKGITLDHDIIVFRRGRESSKQIDNGFTMDGIISTSAFDTLPKKMPSGNPFGDRRYYILLPSGTKILLSEQVIGRGYKDDRYEDVWRGVRKQHEILLRPGTHFKQLSTDSYFKGDKYEQDILLLAEEEK